ncbi:hypothetical protein C2G38_2170081 [Gigaspora rosea]|uniref:RNI-like protein n=1 Tax=Gigaspora rosea TaxID=44941 RepID=A0A397VMY4_9GLOM|nr:hypothetical protein C2G38_2170081 [Gigaspora rosea]
MAKDLRVDSVVVVLPGPQPQDHHKDLLQIYHNNYPPIPTQPGNPANVFPPIPAQPGIRINAPPLAHGQFPPNMGPPLLHHGILARPFPFSGTGFRLTDNQPILQKQDSDDDFDDEEKRQRIAEAVQARVHADNSVNASQHVKHGIKREVKTLNSPHDGSSMRTLQSLSNVSAVVGKLLVNELIKLEKLDALTFKRFTNCNLQNIILDNYFKASDSLLEIISDTQNSSVTKVSLRNCELITDNGFDCLQALQNLRRLNLDSVQLTPPLVPVKPSTYINRNSRHWAIWIEMDGQRVLLINFPNREEELDDILQDFSVIESDLFYSSLTFLSLSGTKLTDVGMSALKDLENLIELYLDRTSITDAGIVYLDGIFKQITYHLQSVKLKYLDVGYTRITDKGVKELRDIPSLQPVRLNGITKEVCEDEYFDI